MAPAERCKDDYRGVRCSISRLVSEADTDDGASLIPRAPIGPRFCIGMRGSLAARRQLVGTWTVIALVVTGVVFLWLRRDWQNEEKLGSSRVGHSLRLEAIDQASAENSDTEVEWEVIREGGVKVHMLPDQSSTSLVLKPQGSIVVGKQQGDWVQLSDAAKGFLQIRLDVNNFQFSQGGFTKAEANQTLLRRRSASYFKIAHGSCAQSGKFPILDSVACRLAASSVGVSNASVHVVRKMFLPEGCYVMSESASGRHTGVWLSINPANSGHGVIADKYFVREPLCSTVSYPANPKYWPSPSLFCWMVIMPDGYELDIAKENYKRRMGIFKCPDYAVYSEEEILIGSNFKTQELGCRQKSSIGSWGSWSNTRVFIRAWELVAIDGRFRSHDWVVKVDPDAVFLAERLPKHLMRLNLPPDAAGFIKNCHNCPNLEFLGPLEVISRSAVEIFAERQSSCESLIQNYTGEDGYVYNCLMQLGIKPSSDYAMLKTAPDQKDCHDSEVVAFHPFKRASNYLECARSAWAAVGGVG